MAHERMNGATVRELARRFNLSKSHVQRIVAHVDIKPPPPISEYYLVPLPGGGYTAMIGYVTPRQRAYRVRDHRRVYA